MWKLFALVAIGAFAASADGSLLQVTDQEILVDNGRFVAAIDQRTGMIERAHLVGSDFELVFQSGAYTLFYPEFEVCDPGGSAGATRAPGYSSTEGLRVTVQADDPDLAMVSAVWTNEWMEVRWTYRFVEGRPYFVVDTEREILQTAVYANAQQCVMFTNDMDDSYIVDYGGEVVQTLRDGWGTFQGSTFSQHSMFTAIDEGLGIRYPAMVWYDQETDITGGALVTWVSPNQRESISYHGGHGGGTATGVCEGQWNWFGKSDSESLYLRAGTTYGMRLCYYLDYGDPDQFDGFNRALFNGRHYDTRTSEDYWAASWGGRSRRQAVHSWNYPQATNNAICSQELLRHRAIGLPRSQNGAQDPQVFDLTVWAVMGGREVDLTPLRTSDDSEPVHAYARTMAQEDRMTGEVGWEVEGLQHSMPYTMLEDSDQLIVSGDVLPIADETEELDVFVRVDFSPRVTAAALIGEDAWDIRCEDAIYGTVGIALYRPTGIDTIVKTGQELRLYLERVTDGDCGSACGWRYEFCLFPHLRDPVERVEDIPPLHSKPVRHYREYYTTLGGLEDRTDLGIRPDPRVWAYQAEVDSLGKSLAIGLYSDPGVYPVRLFFSGSCVHAVRQDGRHLSEADWSFDPDAGVLEVSSTWSGRTMLEVELGAKVAVEAASSEPIPSALALFPNAPNPFNSSTMIRCDLPGPASVTVGIYDLLGRQVAVLVDDVKESGTHAIAWDGRDAYGEPVGSGVYVYRLVTERFAQARRMVLLK